MQNENNEANFINLFLNFIADNFTEYTITQKKLLKIMYDRNDMSRVSGYQGVQLRVLLDKIITEARRRGWAVRAKPRSRGGLIVKLFPGGDMYGNVGHNETDKTDAGDAVQYKTASG